MSKFHFLNISHIQQETADAVSITFDVPANLQSAFRFVQGQYVTIKLPLADKTINRSYSICTPVQQTGRFSIAVKKVQGGLGSNHICTNLKVGDTIEVMEPMGNFHTPLNASHSIHYILFGGGSGITPMLSIIQSVLAAEPESKLTLFYGNRDENSIIFKAKLEELASKESGRLKVVHVLDAPVGEWTAYRGIMNEEMNLRLLRENTNLSFENTEFFICGPGPMMQAAKKAIETLGVLARHIHVEYFTAKEDGEKHEASVGAAAAGSSAPISDGKTRVKIILDGNEHEFEMSVHETILEAALDRGYDPPYSCMVAACCTCRAKLKSGNVKMDDRESLTDDEISKGYVLTCQSHPTTHGVVVSYDE